MAKLTVTEIRKQIAALEVKAARLVDEESKASVAKVRALMSDLGVTLEHLSSAVSRKAAAVKKVIVGKKTATAEKVSKGAAKYQDPKTGATWSGFGRAPGWIAGATNRDAFLVGKSGGHAADAVVKAAVSKKKPAAKNASGTKIAKPAAKKAAASAKKAVHKAVAPIAVKKKSAFKKAAPNTTAKKAAKKGAKPDGAAAASTAKDDAASLAT